MEDENIKNEEETKPETFWQKVKEVGKIAGEIIVKNPMLLIPIVSGVFGIAGRIVSGAAKNHDAWNEHYLSEDDVTGEDFRLKHPMTNEEILELGDRMEGGQSKGDALDEMGLLRNERRRR